MVNDKESVLRDHGASGAVYYDPVKMGSGPIRHTTDEESVLRDHGVSGGVPVDGVLIYGTNDAELKKIVDNIIRADSVDNLEELLSKLSDEAIVKILEKRVCNVLNVLQDRYGLYPEVRKQLGKKIYLDLDIIMKSLFQGRDLFGENINVSNYVGSDDYRSVLGLLDVYRTELEQVGVEIKVINPSTGQEYDVYESIETIKQQAQDKAIEKGYNLGGRSI